MGPLRRWPSDGRREVGSIVGISAAGLCYRSVSLTCVIVRPTACVRSRRCFYEHVFVAHGFTSCRLTHIELSWLACLCLACADVPLAARNKEACGAARNKEVCHFVPCAGLAGVNLGSAPPNSVSFVTSQRFNAQRYEGRQRPGSIAGCATRNPNDDASAAVVLALALRSQTTLSRQES